MWLRLHGLAVSTHTAAMMNRVMFAIVLVCALWACRSPQTTGDQPDVVTTDTAGSQAVLPSDFPVNAAPVMLGTSSVAPVVDGEVYHVMVQLIERAEVQLCLLAFEFVPGEATNKVEDALIRAVDRGVLVRVLVDETVDGAAEFVQRLSAKGASASLDTVGKAHTKMMVMDQAFALVGSTNLSTSSLRYNHEANLLFSTPASVNAALNYCTGRQTNMGDWQSAISPPEVDPRVFGDGKGIEAIKAALQSAQERVDAMIYSVNANISFTDGPVLSLLHEFGDAVERGVSVFVLMERSDYDDTLNAMNEEAAQYMRNLGILVRFDSPDVISHAKLVVADGVAIVSTGNWTYGGLSQNHELTIRTVDETTVGLLRAYAQENYTRGQ